MDHCRGEGEGKEIPSPSPSPLGMKISIMMHASHLTMIELDREQKI